MKILSAHQIKQADLYTIQKQQITSLELMERAASACASWIEQHFPRDRRIFIFCGPGNNGGDGLAISRILIKSGYNIKTWTLHSKSKKSADFISNEKLLIETDPECLKEIASKDDFPFIPDDVVLIDALFGTGLSRPLDGLSAELAEHMNVSSAHIVSVDLPSGLLSDNLPLNGQKIIRASHTLSFQLPKLSFFFPESGKYTGVWEILNIGLDQHFIDNEESDFYCTTGHEVKSLLKTRDKFSHKGNYGHALLVTGSRGMMGASVIATAACTRSGTGLVSVLAPECGLNILQTTVPEAMVLPDSSYDHISRLPEIEKYSAIGIGPGTGTGNDFKLVLEYVLKQSLHPLVLDADALNTISLNPELINLIPVNSILTPHVKEFDRFAGKSKNDAERFEKQRMFSEKNQLIIVLKGAHTCITTPDRRVYFNSSGNPGMAKGGFGDALTGIVTGLLAQDYSPADAAIAGVYIHGLAGDLCAAKLSYSGMTVMDLVHELPLAFRKAEKE